MRPRTNKNDPPPPHTTRGCSGATKREWELRPSGMVVQKRTEEGNRVPPPAIRVRVKYGSTRHEVRISPQATFGELKKALTGPTGLHHHDQKLFYKLKEMDSSKFLDAVGVKDKSKIVLEEDPLSQERRYIEMNKNAQIEKAKRLLSEITLEIDKLAQKVSEIESAIAKGEKSVAEEDVASLIELLMNQLIKLDCITAFDEERKTQEKKVQKNVEILDMLKIKVSSSPPPPPPIQPPQRTLNRSLIDDSPLLNQEPAQSSTLKNPFIITTQWETFDHSNAKAITTNGAAQSSLVWDLL